MCVLISRTRTAKVDDAQISFQYTRQPTINNRHTIVLYRFTRHGLTFCLFLSVFFLFFNLKLNLSGKLDVTRLGSNWIFPTYIMTLHSYAQTRCTCVIGNSDYIIYGCSHLKTRLIVTIHRRTSTYIRTKLLQRRSERGRKTRYDDSPMISSSEWNRWRKKLV